MCLRDSISLQGLQYLYGFPGTQLDLQRLLGTPEEIRETSWTSNASMGSQCSQRHHEIPRDSQEIIWTFRISQGPPEDPKASLILLRTSSLIETPKGTSEMIKDLQEPLDDHRSFVGLRGFLKKPLNTDS